MFKVGRNNLAVTIFVPYDCKNNCPFCTTKQEYSNTSNFSLTNIVKQIHIFNKTTIKEFVITGGEPFANLNQLKVILNAIDDTKKVFINTTLPVTNALDRDELISFINSYKNKITCLNVSRHIMFDFKTVDDTILKHINVPYRINCVIPKLTFEEYMKLTNKFDKFILKYQAASIISFRADYTKIDQSNLKTLDDPFIKFVTDKNGLYAEYLESGGCLVCNNDDFICGYNRITYHRGTEHSCVRVGSTTVVNDIIIKQDGNVYYDWDKSDENISQLIEQLKIHPNKINGDEEHNTTTQSRSHNNVNNKAFDIKDIVVDTDDEPSIADIFTDILGTYLLENIKDILDPHDQDHDCGGNNECGPSGC